MVPEGDMHASYIGKELIVLPSYDIFEQGVAQNNTPKSEIVGHIPSWKPQHSD